MQVEKVLQVCDSIGHGREKTATSRYAHRPAFPIVSLVRSPTIESSLTSTRLLSICMSKLLRISASLPPSGLDHCLIARFSFSRLLKPSASKFLRGDGDAPSKPDGCS